MSGKNLKGMEIKIEKGGEGMANDMDYNDMMRLIEESKTIREFAEKGDFEFVEKTTLQSLHMAYLMGQKDSLQKGIKAVERIRDILV